MVSELFFAAAGVSLFFAFWNGFTDAANAIATIVATRTLAPFRAVALSAVGNFLGLYFGGAVATTIWAGILNAGAVDASGIALGVIYIGAILGGLLWDVITWYFGLPCSETHVLVGSLVGVGLFLGGVGAVQFDSVLRKVVLPMLYSPILAFAFAFGFTALIIWLFRRFPPTRINKRFRQMQIVSSFVFSFSHGSQDGQKVVGLLLGLLLAERLYAPGSPTPIWVLLAVQLALSLGTMFGGWRIVKTMAVRITKLRPYQGFSAEAGAAIVLLGTATVGFPVSTTHAINSAIMGVGATQRLSAVRWGVARRIVWAWILTIPLSAIFGFLVLAALYLIGLR